MDRGRSPGGLPPDEVVEDRDEILAATEEAIDTYHDPSFSSMLRVAVAPCSPFSVSEELMTGAAALARRKGVRLHTHLAETLDEEEHCREQFGLHAGRLHGEARLARPRRVVRARRAPARRRHPAVRRDRHRLRALPQLQRAARRGHRAGSATCCEAGAPVGLGVDGAASSELTSLAGEMRQALLFQRAGTGRRALTARQALELATLGGARYLGRQDEIGTLEPGKLADIARLAGRRPSRAAVADPVCALVFGAGSRRWSSCWSAPTVVEGDELRTVAQDELAARGRGRPPPERVADDQGRAAGDRVVRQARMTRLAGQCRR